MNSDTQPRSNPAAKNWLAQAREHTGKQNYAAALGCLENALKLEETSDTLCEIAGVHRHLLNDESAKIRSGMAAQITPAASVSR